MENPEATNRNYKKTEVLASTQLLKQIDKAEKKNTQLISRIYEARRERELFEQKYIAITRSKMWHRTQVVRKFVDTLKARLSQKKK